MRVKLQLEMHRSIKREVKAKAKVDILSYGHKLQRCKLGLKPQVRNLDDNGTSYTLYLGSRAADSSCNRRYAELCTSFFYDF